MKYIIELDDNQLLEYGKDTDTYFRTLYKAKGFNALVFDKNGLDKLTPLDKELKEAYLQGKHDAEQDLARAAYDEAYQKGVHDGSLDVKQRVDGAYQKGYEAGQHEATTLEYQQGLNDAWECAKYLFSEMSNTEINLVFPQEWNNGGFKALMALHPQDAIDRIKTYEEQKKADAEIKVGDEVCFVFAGGETIEPFIVFSIKDDNGKKYYEGIQTSDGRWVSGGLKYYKTGRHFPQVAELLEAMKEGAQ